jgi:transposase
VRSCYVTSAPIPTVGDLGQRRIGGWLADQKFAQPAQQIVLEESIEAVRLGEQRRERVDGYLRAQIPSWSLFALVRNLCALRGFDTIIGAGVAATIGDPSRFASASDFMSYLGLVPSEHSSGPKRRIGAITKAGDIHARTLLIEAAHSYRYPARVTRHKLVPRHSDFDSLAVSG